MTDQELLTIWKSYDQKMNEVLTLNKKVAHEMTKANLYKTINTLRFPKSILLLIGIPYTLVLCFLTWVTYQAAAYIMMLGFGGISLIMLGVIIGYCYHLYLIAQINHAEEIAVVQKRLAQLQLSSYNIARLAVVQLPFWSICWVSREGLSQSPLWYGGVNVLVFLALSYVAYYLYRNLSVDQTDSWVSQFFFSGREWEPIKKSIDLLEQLEE